MIISTHVPRAGGRSFEKILVDINGSKKVLQDLFPLKKDGAKIAGLDPQKWLSIIADRRVRVIHGHNAKYWKWSPHFPNAAFISWVRDPVNRVLSAFYREKRLKLKGGLSVSDFTEDGLIRWARMMGKEMESQYFPPGVLEKYKYVGVIENYKKHADIICKALFGTAPKRIPHISKNMDNHELPQNSNDKIERLGNSSMKLWDDFADDIVVRSKIADLCKYEMRIYDTVIENWEKGKYET